MNNTTITNNRLREFCDTILHQAREVLYEREEDILKAWHENIEEAQQSDKKFPPLKLSLGATVNLEESTIETTLRFTAVYQSSLSTEIQDPNQQELPGIAGKFAKAARGADVAIVVDGETVYDSADDDNDFGGMRRADATKCINAMAKEKKKANRELLLDKMVEDYGDAGAIELARLAAPLSDIPKDVREMILERAREADPSGQHGDY